MAQIKDYRSQYKHLYDRTDWFVRWLTYPDGYTVWDSTLGRAIHDGHAPDSVLDYLLAWLVEGQGAEHCPTYEDWLLTIVSVADQLRRGVFGREDVGSNTSADGWTIEQIKRESDGRIDLSIPLLDDDLDLSHPALDRVVYERAQSLMKVNDK